VVLFGSEYWSPLRDWVRTRALPEGMVSADDLDLLHVTDDPVEAVQCVLDRYVERESEADSPHEARKADAQ
ncbi:MAG TPA: hypothetical protein VGH92_03125, partial [Gaiellaceae bacterium]